MKSGLRRIRVLPFTIFYILLIAAYPVTAQISRTAGSTEGSTYKIDWKGIEEVRINDQEVISILAFTEAVYPYDYQIPVWHTLHQHKSRGLTTIADVIVLSTTPLSAQEALIVMGSVHIKSEFSVEINRAVVRKELFSSIFVMPIRQTGDGRYERLDEFELRIREDSGEAEFKAPQLRKTASVLSTGEWHKLRVNRSGIYRIDYSQLSSMGLAGVNSANIQLYGMGGALLPETAGAPRPDGLQDRKSTRLNSSHT